MAKDSLGMFSQVYKKFVPVNARTLIDTARGDMSPITEANFSPDELAVLRNIYDKRREFNKTWKQDIAGEVAKSEVEYNKKPDMQLVQVPHGNDKPEGYASYVPGPVPYDEYIRKSKVRLGSFDKNPDKTSISYYDYPDGLAAPTFDSWVGAIKKSYTDPAFRMKTILGNFNVNETPSGAVVTDQYKFNAKNFYEMQGIDFEKSTAYDMWKRSNGPADFLDMMMIKYAPKASRPVNIKLPESQPRAYQPLDILQDTTKQNIFK